MRRRKDQRAANLGGGSTENAMAHEFVIEPNKAGEYVAKFRYNGEIIF